MTSPGYLSTSSPGSGSKTRSTAWFEFVGTSHTAHRFFVWSSVSGGDPQVSTPSAGASVDGVGGTSVDSGVAAGRGNIAKVEAGESISAGDDLETNGSGQAVTASGGTVVARALEGASSGQTLWIAFTGN